MSLVEEFRGDKTLCPPSVYPQSSEVVGAGCKNIGKSRETIDDFLRRLKIIRQDQVQRNPIL